MLSTFNNLLAASDSQFDSTVFAILIVVALFLRAAIKILGPRGQSRRE